MSATGAAGTTGGATASTSTPAAAAASSSSSNTNTYIPMAAYLMPAPTWKVKPQFASWEIDHTRFEIKRLLGKGSYGSVAEATDHLTGQRVAIKKIPNIFEVFENAKRIYREIRILRLLSHANVVRITHLQAPSDLLAFNDLYIVFECLDTDFAKLTRDDTQCLTIPHVRWFLYQLLLSMKYVHSAHIIHRDIKPANILLTEACDLKLCDFGLARTVDAEADAEDEDVRDMLGVAGRSAAGTEESTPGSGSAAAAGGTSGGAAGGDHHVPAAKIGGAPMGGTASGTSATATAAAAGTGATAAAPVVRSMTRHVVTRWYRAPELPLYNDGEYTTAIDVWSVGCVYAEMLGMLDTGEPECRYDRRALFPGGSCYPMSKDRAKDKTGKEKKDQLAIIMDVLGTPTEDEIGRVRTEAARDYLRSLKPKRPEDLNKRYPTAGAEATDLLRKFLRFNPEDRITIDEALAHPFLAPVRRPADETVRKEGPIHFRRVSPENIRDLFVHEVRCYNPQIPDNWKELAAAGLYEWRALMESQAAGGVGGTGSPGDADYYSRSGGGTY